MGRIAFWALLALALFIGFQWSRRQRVKAREQKRVQAREASANDPIAMVECPQCHTHFPQGEAVMGGGKAYCSEACREKARKNA